MGLPATEAAKTQIEPPEASTVEALAHQMNNGLWDHLLKGAEGAFRSNDPLWLDLQRYVCAAMTGLGPQYDAARATVMGLTGALVKRLGDGVFELRFRNGEALCNGETKMWIESEVAPAQPGGGGGVSAGDGRLAEASEKAKKLAASGKLKEAVAELQDGLATCAQRRDRFLWRLRIAQLCHDAQRFRLAAPLLEECYEEVRRYHIDEWEPSLTVAVAQTLYRCRKALTASSKEPGPEALQGVRESFAWLCQLDPLAALAAEPSGK
jgi:type VI secretion system ImpA/VasJ family protein